MYAIGEEEIKAVRRVIESRQLFRYRGGEGGECDQFEAEFAAKIGCRQALALTSGTAALTCALAGMGIGPGDDVIVPAYTFMATPLAVLAVGAVPVIAEVDESLTIDPADLERRITSRTKAVIPVHMLGLPCDMGRVLSVTRRRKVRVLEDACQAVGGSYRGRRLGSIGHAGAFSFNHFKIITCGEGGAVVTNDTRIYHGALIHHDGGCSFRRHASEMVVPIFAGLNFRVSEIQGAILRVQLRRLDGILARLRARKKAMVEILRQAPRLTLNPVRDPEGDCGATVPMLFESAAAMRAFQGAAKAQGIGLSSPIDSGMHVYSNWTPIMEKRGAHHPRRDAFRLAGRSVWYSRTMCPRTTDILSRTACVSVNLNLPLSDARRIARVLQRLSK